MSEEKGDTDIVLLLDMYACMAEYIQLIPRYVLQVAEDKGKADGKLKYIIVPAATPEGNLIDILNRINVLESYVNFIEYYFK